MSCGNTGMITPNEIMSSTTVMKMKMNAARARVITGGFSQAVRRLDYVARHTVAPMNDDPLWLDAETMRALGRDAVELVTSRLTRPWDATPIVSALSPDELAARLSEPAPEGPHGFAELLSRLDRDVL